MSAEGINYEDVRGEEADIRNFFAGAEEGMPAIDEGGEVDTLEALSAITGVPVGALDEFRIKEGEE